MELLGIVGALVLLFCFCKLLHVKIMHPYEGRHHLGHKNLVPATYHPADSAWVPESVRYRGWWNTRMARLADQRPSWLTCPLYVFEERYQALLTSALSNWTWVHVDIEYWPRAWLTTVIKPIQIAGSELPARDQNLTDWMVAV